MFPLLIASPLAAQSSVSVGVTAGTAKLTDQRSEQAVSAVLQLQATPWLTFSTIPSVVHVRDVVSGRPVSSNGFGDLPLSAAAAHTFQRPGAPTLAAALTLALPTGNVACGLGAGSTSAGLDIGVGASPEPKWHVSADASRSISNLSSQSTLSAPRATALLVGSGYDVAPTWRGDLSLGVDVGHADSTQALSRVIGGGLTHRLGRSLALTMDGSVGLTASSPKWVLSLGLGSTFASTSPVAPSAPLKRLRSSFSGGVNHQKLGCK
jgi:hypothetical protein